jgi:hypothetical protein
VRWKICNIASRVCDVSHGGRKVHSFSITAFARAIELDPKTLHQWMRVKKLVLDKLPAVELKDVSKYNYQDLALVCDKLSKDSSRKEVLNTWRAHLALPLETKKFIKYDKHLNAILYNAQRPMNLLLIDKEVILQISEKCRTISKLLDIELRLRDKFSSEHRLQEDRLKRSTAIKEARE